MKQSFSRRQALKGVATAGAGALLNPALGIPQDGSIQVAGRPVEITLTAASPQTVRITIQPIENGQPLPILADDIVGQGELGAASRASTDAIRFAQREVRRPHGQDFGQPADDSRGRQRRPSDSRAETRRGHRQCQFSGRRQPTVRSRAGRTPIRSPRAAGPNAQRPGRLPASNAWRRKCQFNC